MKNFYEEAKELFGDMRNLTTEENQAYMNSLIENSEPTGINIFEPNKLLILFKKLREATHKLDIAFCDLIERDECTLNGSEYEEINNVLIEVDEYLKALDS